MIHSFRNKGTEDVYHGNNTRHARKTCPQQIWRVARRKLDRIHSVKRLEELAIPAGNELKALQKDRKGQHSIRINDQYRICFVWTDEGVVDHVEITDYH